MKLQGTLASKNCVSIFFLSFYLSIYLDIFLSICLLTHLGPEGLCCRELQQQRTAYLFLSFYLKSIYLSIYIYTLISRICRGFQQQELFIHLFPLYLPIYLFIYLYIYISIQDLRKLQGTLAAKNCLPIHLSIYLFIYLSIYLGPEG